jgi:hypothetical protein
VLRWGKFRQNFQEFWKGPALASACAALFRASELPRAGLALENFCDDGERPNRQDGSSRERTAEFGKAVLTISGNFFTSRDRGMLGALVFPFSSSSPS